VRPVGRSFRVLFFLLAVGCVKARPPGTVELPRRDVTLVFQVEVASIPQGSKELTLWVPVPRDERVQVLRSVGSDSPNAEVVADLRGNPALRIVVDGPAAAASAQVTVAISRVEERGAGELKSHPVGLIDFTKEDRPEQWLADGPNVVDARVREIAADLYRDAAGDEEKARAAFEYGLAHTQRGDCADVHALFVGLLRAGGVPVRSRVGFPLPPGPGEGKVDGYRCWAEWWSKERGWLPVDLSEAWKHPEKREYLFGNLDADRVGVSLGSDVRFPGQAGPALHDFVYPYAELDGVPAQVTTRVTWEEKR